MVLKSAKEFLIITLLMPNSAITTHVTQWAVKAFPELTLQKLLKLWLVVRGCKK